MERNEIELADFKEQANTYYKNLTKNAPHKGIGSHEYIYFAYGIEWAFNHLPQNNYDKLKEDNALLLDALKEVLIWGSVKGKQFTYTTSPDKRDEFMNLINKIEQSK